MSHDPSSPTPPEAPDATPPHDGGHVPSGETPRAPAAPDTPPVTLIKRWRMRSGQ